MMALVIILVIIGLLVLGYFIGSEFQQIAEEKGFVGKAYFWWTVFLGPVGMFMVIALPDRKIKVQKETNQ